MGRRGQGCLRGHRGSFDAGRELRGSERGSGWCRHRRIVGRSLCSREDVSRSSAGCLNQRRLGRRLSLAGLWRRERTDCRMLLRFVSDLSPTIQCIGRAYWRCGTRGCPPGGRYGRDRPNVCSVLLCLCFGFAGAYLGIYVDHDIVSLSVRHVVVWCCVIESASTNRKMVRGRATWGDVVGEAPCGPRFKATPSLYSIPSLLINNIQSGTCNSIECIEKDTLVSS